MMKRILIPSFVILLAFSVNVSAKTLDIKPGHGVLGLKEKSTEAEFRQLLGEPSSIINMGPDRHGLLYGRNVMLIFWGGSLWEARTWLVKGLTPELYHEWLQYVPAKKSGFSDFTVDGKFHIGETRGEVEKEVKGQEGDSDEFSIIVAKGHKQIWFGFEYDENDASNPKDVNKQKLVSLTVRFPDPGRRLKSG